MVFRNLIPRNMINIRHCKILPYLNQSDIVKYVFKVTAEFTDLL